MSTIILSNYPALYAFEIVAQTGLTSATASTTVNGGKYGSAAGGFVGLNFVSGTGASIDNAVGTATTELTSLVGAINAFRAILPSTTLNTTYAAVPLTLVGGRDYKSASSLTFSGTTITFDGQGNPDAQFFVTAEAGAIVFNTTTNIVLINGANAANIFWRAQTAITFTTMGTPVYGNLIAGTQITSATGTTFNGRMYAQTADITFSGISVANAINTVVPCYAKGTQILTPSGYIAIENLKAGDSVVIAGKIRGNNVSLHSAASEKISWISKFTVDTFSAKSRPICIKQNAIGFNAPFENLYVSPDHGIVFGDKLVAAKNLVDGTTIVQEFDHDEVTYYHFELRGHSAVLANGVLAETFLDMRNRIAFEPSVNLVVPQFAWSGIKAN